MGVFIFRPTNKPEMSYTPEFRPRFKFELARDNQEISDSILNYAKADSGLHVRKTHHHIILSYPIAQRHFWSPFLDISIEQESKSEPSLIRCLIGPAPNIWTMFMFIYGLFGFVGFIGLTLGLSQWTLKTDMWGFWLILVSAVGMIAMYLVSLEGRKLAKYEMMALKHHIDEALGCDCFKLHDEFMA